MVELLGICVFMLRKPELYNTAIALRRKGFSYNEILEHVRVGQGTISRWCQGIELTKKQKERLTEKQRNTPLIRMRMRQAADSRKEAKSWAEERVDTLSQDESTLLISGITLYWAEGTKLKDTREGHKSIEFTNTDPIMIKIMMQFFTQVLEIPRDKIKIMVRIGKEGDVRRAKNFWLHVTELSQKNLVSPEILSLSRRSTSLNKYPYGMCRIRIHDVSAARRVSALIGEFCKSQILEK